MFLTDVLHLFCPRLLIVSLTTIVAATAAAAAAAAAAAEYRSASRGFSAGWWGRLLGYNKV